MVKKTFSIALESPLLILNNLNDDFQKPVFNSIPLPPNDITASEDYYNEDDNDEIKRLWSWAPENHTNWWHYYASFDDCNAIDGHYEMNRLWSLPL